MSFVIPKSEKISIFSPKPQVENSPAYYHKQQPKIPEQCAPFNSSDNKVSCFHQPQTPYGPGYYKDVNINQLYQIKKTFAQTSAFVSKVQRFKTMPSLSLTDFYQNPLKQSSFHIKNVKNKDLMDEIRLQNRKKRVQAIKSTKSFVRVLITNPNNTQNSVSHYIDSQIVKKMNGPGSYNIMENQTKKKPISIQDWSKQQKARFQKIKDQNPGVGKYDLKDIKRSQARSASFLFSGIRSHLDEIIYETRNPLKLMILQHAQIKSQSPGPGQYSLQGPSHKSFNCLAHTFTGPQRFREASIKKEHRNVGPGEYEFSSGFEKHEMTSTLKQIRKKLLQVTKQRLKFKKPMNAGKNLAIIKSDESFQNLKHKKNSIHRGQIINTLKERCISKYGDMSQEERFKSLSEVHQETIFYDTIQRQNKSGHKHVFSSTSNRLLEQNGKVSSAPFYQVDINDINSKLQKTKNSIMNLKRISVEKIPFGSGVQRFKTQVSQVTNKNNFQPLRRQRVIITRKQQIKPSPAFKSKSSRGINQIKSENQPGPGSYHNIEKKLIKDSFNLNYNYEVPIVSKKTHLINVRQSNCLQT